MTCRLSFRRYHLAFRRPVRTAHGPWPAREGLIVRLEGPGGGLGWGEAAPLEGFGTESIEEAAGACQALGESVTDGMLAALPARLVCLRAALGTAMDEVAAAPRKGVSAIPPYLPVAALLPAGRAALAEIGPKAEAGFRVFKWKVAVGDPQDELAMLDNLCGALPSGGKMRLDANGGWDRRRAELWLDRCADRPIEHVEQPIDRDARGADDLLQGLAGDHPTPVALDESLGGPEDAARWIDAGWPGVYVLKPALLGRGGTVLDRLAAAGAAVVFSSALETAAGARAALRIAWDWPGERRALGFGVWPLFSDPRFDGPASGPFLRREDVEGIDPQRLWTALS